MKEYLEPIKSESLTDLFVARFERLILSGKVRIGERLPSERELAEQLGVSRPVVHEGLLELSHRGLVSMTPRVGTVVNDYRTEGSLALLESLLNYRNGAIDPNLLDSLLQVRLLFETETARLAAVNRTDEQAAEMRAIVDQERESIDAGADVWVALDFRFHLLLAMASGNLVYPLFLNSFKPVYTSLTEMFFSKTRIATAVNEQHSRLAAAVAGHNETDAEQVMREILHFGAEVLRKQMGGEK